jgi:hypothetical protein
MSKYAKPQPAAVTQPRTSMLFQELFYKHPFMQKLPLYLTGLRMKEPLPTALLTATSICEPVFANKAQLNGVQTAPNMQGAV